MKLSVLMITYNHERYIRQALDGVLEQETQFDYEIVVGEDCSTDSTRAILLEYARKHPERFRLLLRERNMGAIPNFFSTLDQCHGQYVALLEGDDYWTSPRKLQKQVEFLDAHPDYAICFHNVTGHFEGGEQPDFHYVRADQQESMALEDLLQDNVIPTCSAVFRNGLAQPYPSWVFELKMGDYPLHILNAQHGRIGYLNKLMGVYRIHPGGLWTGLDWIERLKLNVSLFEHLARDLKPPGRPAARLVLARKYWQLATEFELRGDTKQARHYTLRSMRTRLRTPSPSVRHKIKVLTRLSAPGPYYAAHRLYGKLRHANHVAVPAIQVKPGTPRLSVVIPTYNAQRYLLEALESTLGQTYEDFECLVIDDGSLDRTPTILTELARRDPRLRPIRIPHGGIVEALNAGLREARGELIARMDADDVCFSERFETQVRFLDQHPECVAVGSRALLVDPFGSPLWEIDVHTEHDRIEADLLKGNGWALFHPTAIIRQSAMRQIGGYRSEYQWSEDIDLFLRLAEVGRLSNVPRALLRYRQHFGSVNRTKVDLQLRRNRQLLTEAYRRRGRALPPDFRLEPPPQLAPYEQIRAWARRAIINRNFRIARRHAMAAVRFAPLKYDSWSLVYHAVSGR